MPKELEIKVELVYIGNSNESLVKTSVGQIEVNLEGIVGDKHAGFTKTADARDRELYKDNVIKGAIVRNWRQWSAVEAQEISRVAKNLGLDSLDPALLGPNILFSDLENFSKLPKGTTIWFPEEAVLYVEDENLPCIGPGEEISRQYPQIKPSAFVKAAFDLRGLVGTVYRPGIIRAGDYAIVRVYQPRRYSIGSPTYS